MPWHHDPCCRRSGGASLRCYSEAQGVASGDPFPKSVILWTRVTVAAKNKPATLVRAAAPLSRAWSHKELSKHPKAANA
jgi:phosphodiesterase/alkaline phosphatase D-like protein